MATATYAFIGKPAVSVNGKTLTTDQKTYLIVSLKRESNTWLISHISFEVK
jgi:hypothetical protein